MSGHLERHLAESDAAAGVRRVQDLERQLAATVDELTAAQTAYDGTLTVLDAAQTENARLAALVVGAFEQRDAAQARQQWAERDLGTLQQALVTVAQRADQAEAQRDRALEQLAASEARSKERLDAARWMSDRVDTLRGSLDRFLRDQT